MDKLYNFHIFLLLLLINPQLIIRVDSFQASVLFSVPMQVCSATSSRVGAVPSNCSRFTDTNQLSTFTVVPRTGNVIYYDDKESGIFEGTFGGSNSAVTRKIVDVFGHVTSISFDWLHENIYWTNSNASKIEACSVAGGGIVDIVDENVALPLAVAVDPITKRVFFSYVSSAMARIESCDLTGSNRKIVVADVIVWPDHIVVDHTASRWVDFQHSSKFSDHFNH